MFHVSFLIGYIKLNTNTNALEGINVRLFYSNH